MKKAIVLSSSDAQLLNDVLDYFINIDSREEKDFIENHGESAFNEYKVLQHDQCREAKHHIFYKLTLLQKELLEAEND